MSCLLSCNGVHRPTTVRQLARGVGAGGADGNGAVCLNNLMTRLGPAPRPFYVVGHNPNSIAEVHAALDAGANAIEPDVNVYQFTNQLCISETPVALTKLGGTAFAPSLADFLDDLHEVAVNRPELALVVFDCKPQAARAKLGALLRDEIRTRLTYDTNVNVIISVADRAHAHIFDEIRFGLLAREGLMVDSDNSPSAVSDWVFSDVDNQCYGNGIANDFRNPLFAPNIRPSIENACAMRAESGRIKFIYTWSIGFQDRDDMREYIRIGADGIIAGFRPAAFDQISVMFLRAVIEEPEFRSTIRLATREDNPFVPQNAAYALLIRTGNDGTDANITFTLTGKFGSARKVVGTEVVGRMERHQWNYVTLPSQDLGPLESITVQRDDNGNRPDWYLDVIRVHSSRYRVRKEAQFFRTIDSTSPVTALLQ